MHGYGIAQHIQQVSESVLQVEEARSYPALQRMLIKGWVKRSGACRRTTGERVTTSSRWREKKQVTAEVAEFTRVMEAITRVNPACLKAVWQK